MGTFVCRSRSKPRDDEPKRVSQGMMRLLVAAPPLMDDKEKDDDDGDDRRLT